MIESFADDETWRVCFTWGRNGPARVEIADYHD
jgi:plasmid maintenance system killer protein